MCVLPNRSLTREVLVSRRQDEGSYQFQLQLLYSKIGQTHPKRLKKACKKKENSDKNKYEHAYSSTKLLGIRI